MYFACLLCLQKEETKLEDCILYIAKYYPNTGWYLRSEEAHEWIDKWFDEHKHAPKVSREGGRPLTWEQAMYGAYITLIYEDQLQDPMTKDKRAVVEAIFKAQQS